PGACRRRSRSRWSAPSWPRVMLSPRHETRSVAVPPWSGSPVATAGSVVRASSVMAPPDRGRRAETLPVWGAAGRTLGGRVRAQGGRGPRATGGAAAPVRLLVRGVPAERFPGRGAPRAAPPGADGGDQPV